MRRALPGETWLETKASARTRAYWAAAATPIPWLPLEAAITPAAACSEVREKILLVAPRSLNDPVCCRFSSLKKMRTGMSGKMEDTSSRGVLSTDERMREWAARTSSWRMELLLHAHLRLQLVHHGERNRDVR